MIALNYINQHKYLLIAALALFIIAIILSRFENFTGVTYDISNSGSAQTCITKLQCIDKQDCINGTCLNIQPYCFTHGTTTDSIDSSSIDKSQTSSVSWSCKGSTGSYNKTVTCGSQKVVMDDTNKFAYCN